MAPRTQPTKTTAGAGALKYTLRVPAIQKTIASAEFLIAASHKITQAAPINPIAVEFNPWSTTLNQNMWRRRAQKGTIANIRMTPGPNNPTYATSAPGMPMKKKK